MYNLDYYDSEFYGMNVFNEFAVENQENITISNESNFNQYINYSFLFLSNMFFALFR